MNIFSTKGRLNRLAYFGHCIIDDIAIIGLIGLLIALKLSTGIETGILNGIILSLIGIVFFLGIWSEIAATVKRLHDLGKPGSHFFLGLIPIYNIYLGLILLFGKGNSEANEYGENPLMEKLNKKAQKPVNDGNVKKIDEVVK